jgi:hypothetical protein
MPTEGPVIGEAWEVLDADAKRQPQGDGIRPIEHVPFKIIKPIQ